MIGVVDYGLGNVEAILNVYKALDIPAGRVRSPDDVKESNRLVLPGVGSFDHAMRKLDLSGLRSQLDKAVLGDGVLFLGICVGMQMMAGRSEEGVEKGLGWIPGEVKRLNVDALEQKPHLPHMGWNTIRLHADSHLLHGLDSDAEFYFLHSYAFIPEADTVTLSETSYGASFASAVGFRNRYGVQFHPEKSHRWGMQVLSNFASM